MENVEDQTDHLSLLLFAKMLHASLTLWRHYDVQTHLVYRNPV